MSAPLAKDRSPEDLDKLALRGYEDPVFFSLTFLSHLYGGEEPGDGLSGPMPWFHPPTFAILLRKTEFLWTYGSVAKIMREFLSLIHI